MDRRLLYLGLLCFSIVVTIVYLVLQPNEYSEGETMLFRVGNKFEVKCKTDALVDAASTDGPFEIQTKNDPIKGQPFLLGIHFVKDHRVMCNDTWAVKSGDGEISIKGEDVNIIVYPSGTDYFFVIVLAILVFLLVVIFIIYLTLP